MKQCNFKEILPIDNISQEKSWMKVYEKLEGITEDIEINFDGVNVVEPWRFKAFQMLLTKNTHVYMTFTNKEDLVSRLHMSCIINGVSTDRVKNIVVVKEKVKTPEELKIEKKGKELMTRFQIDSNNVATLKTYEIYSQMHSGSTVSYIGSAIEQLNTEKEITEFIIDLGSISVQLNVLNHLADKIVQYESKGINIAVDTTDEEISKNIKLFLHQCKNNAYNDIVKRYEKIKAAIKSNTPGMFLRYKSSKALDEFGRHGKGEIVSSRIAIFRQIRIVTNKKIKNEQDLRESKIMAVIDTYNNDYFYTKLHWMLEHDNEQLKRLPVDRYEVDISDLGFCDDFLGSRYHFMLPIQKDKKESVPVITGLNDEGRNIKKLCTIPERMKIVFDDWEVKYNEESLDNSIKLTQEKLEEN